jgi:phage tail-like protein
MLALQNDLNQTAIIFDEQQIVERDTPNGLLKYLPDIYSEADEAGALFMDGFLRVLDSIWAPLERQISQLYAYFDPALTPTEFLPWLGTWVDLVLDENWHESRRRVLIQRAAELYRRRGTANALRDYLEVYTGMKPEIEEDETMPFHFTVRFTTPLDSSVSQERIQRIIEQEKPAHTTYSLVLETA